jgi:hypothetical protein
LFKQNKKPMYMSEKLTLNNFKHSSKGYGKWWLSFTQNNKQWTIYTTESQLIYDLFHSEKYLSQKFLNSVKKHIKTK